jgi:hypothetical protein
VGAVILAPGFAPFDPSIFETYSYAAHPNVVTSLEFERILSASGPYEGHLVRPSDDQEPQKNRLAPVRGIPGPQRLRQWVLLIGVLHVRQQAGRHCQRTQRHGTGHGHLFHGHAHLRQGVRQVRQPGPGRPRGASLSARASIRSFRPTRPAAHRLRHRVGQ